MNADSETSGLPDTPADGDTIRLRRGLADRLQARGVLSSPGWRHAVETVPREAFLGDRVYRRADDAGQTRWQPYSRASMSQQDWLALANTDETFVTQLDFTDTTYDSNIDSSIVSGVVGDDGGAVPGEPTSSSTLPSLVVRMLGDLQVADGARVLEIGTGTGYSTALMCARLGAANVTSIEIDPDVADRARRSLAATGYAPRLIRGDGLAGDPDGAPYDALIATCSVRRIPRPWLDQIRVGGTILATLSGWLLGSALARVHITGAGLATGRFLPGFVQFMPARPHAAPPMRNLPPEDGHGHADGPGDRRGYTESGCIFGVDLLDDPTGRLLAQLAAPAAQYLPPYVGSQPPMHLLVDQEQGAWARVYQTPAGAWRVRQSGPVRLWDDIEHAWTVWTQGGRPTHDQLTVDITPTAQTVQLATPAGTQTWKLP